jgi:four helix bundle protein
MKISVNASKPVQNYKDLETYKASFRFQQAVFLVSKAFPKEETYSLTDQIRRSSRSIGGNLAEAWAKRHYPAHFLSKLTDADGELQESLNWLRTAYCCEYVTEAKSTELAAQAEEIGRMLGGMIERHLDFCNPG